MTRNDAKMDADEAAVARRVLRALRRWDRHLETEMSDGLTITEIRIRAAREPGGEMLVTIKAQTSDGQRFVGFHGAFTLEEAMRGALERIDNATLKWREDRPYGARETP
jgi:hypothetical protein